MPLPIPLRSSSCNNSHANPSAYYRREHQTETKRFERVTPGVRRSKAENYHDYHQRGLWLNFRSLLLGLRLLS